MRPAYHSRAPTSPAASLAAPLARGGGRETLAAGQEGVAAAGWGGEGRTAFLLFLRKNTRRRARTVDGGRERAGLMAEGGRTGQRGQTH
jgi:hypothetical protein